MYRIDHRSFDRICMTAKATAPGGRKVKVKLTYAFGPQLTAYNETDGHWLTSSEWQWCNL